jgi:bifunctional DNase/RNase
MSRMVEVTIDSVRVSLTSQQRIVVLREVERERYLTIWIGPYEAEAITIALQEIEVSRPQTHDLIKSVMQSMNGRLLRVEVVALKDDVYFGNLVIEQEERIVHVDSRPSDALALAVRAHVPVLVSQEVMDAAGIIPEEETPQQPGDIPPAVDLPTDEKPAADSQDRLSVFKDFIDKLDLDDEDRPAPAEDSDEPDQQK